MTLSLVGTLKKKERRLKERLQPPSFCKEFRPDPEPLLGNCHGRQSRTAGEIRLSGMKRGAWGLRLVEPTPRRET